MAIADGKQSDREILVQQIIEYLQRVDLRPIERANAFKSLIEQHKWDQKRQASELCVSPGTVSNALKLLKLDEETQAKVDADEVKATVAISQARRTRTATKKKRSRKPKPLSFRTTARKVTVEPKAGKSYEEVLQAALYAAQE